MVVIYWSEGYSVCCVSYVLLKLKDGRGNLSKRVYWTLDQQTKRKHKVTQEVKDFQYSVERVVTG